VFSINPANPDCTIVLTKSAITSVDLGDPTKVSVSWSLTGVEKTGLTFAVTDETNGCLNC
jgi:hypothetical protein